MEGGLVRDWADVCVLNGDAETLLRGKVVELVVDIVGVAYISF